MLDVPKESVLGALSASSFTSETEASGAWVVVDVVVVVVVVVVDFGFLPLSLPLARN